MYEVEVKVRADHASVRDRLDDVGAESLDRVRQVDTYYDAPHRDFAETDEALRVRREYATGAARTDDPQADDAVERRPDSRGAGGGTAGSETSVVTYKGPLVEADSKTRREAETAIGDPAAFEAVLDGLGFTPATTVEKERERHEYEGFTVTLDDVNCLGEFVEVERESERVDVAREGAFAVLHDLGLDPADQIRTSYLGLLLEAGSDGGGETDDVGHASSGAADDVEQASDDEPNRYGNNQE